MLPSKQSGEVESQEERLMGLGRWGMGYSRDLAAGTLGMVSRVGRVGTVGTTGTLQMPLRVQHFQQVQQVKQVN